MLEQATTNPKSEKTMTEIIKAEPLDVPDSISLRYLPEGPMVLGNHKISWVGIQHGSDSTNGSLNVLDLDTMTNQSYDLPGRQVSLFQQRTQILLSLAANAHWDSFA